jgi:hypothetical protein
MLRDPGARALREMALETEISCLNAMHMEPRARPRPGAEALADLARQGGRPDHHPRLARRPGYCSAKTIEKCRERSCSSASFVPRLSVVWRTGVRKSCLPN